MSFNESFLPPSSNVYDYVLAAGVAETITTPANAKFAVFNYTRDIWVRYGGTAAVPSGDVTDGTGSMFNPAGFAVDGVASLSVISGFDATVSVAWYS